MKKLTSTLAAGTALLAATSLAQVTTVKADTSADPNQARDTQAAAPTSVEEQTKLVEASKKAADDAKAKAEQAQSNLNNAQKDLQNASPENIEKAKAAIPEAEAKVAPAQAAVTAAEKDAQTAKAAEDAQNSKVAEADKKVAAAQEEVKTAQTAVAQAQAAVDGQVENPAVKEARSQADAAKATVITREAELETAKKADAERKAKLAQAQEAVKTAEADVAAKAAIVKTFNQVRNTFTLSRDYINAMTSKKVGSSALSAENQQILEREAATLKSSNNYVSNPDDVARTYNINNLPQDVVKELNYYMQDLINQIHKQIGSADTVLTQNMIDYSEALAKAARAQRTTAKENSSPTNTAVNTDSATRSQYGLENYGLKPSSTNQIWWYNRLDSKENVSVDELKRNIYDIIKKQLFEKDEATNPWISAQKITGTLDSQNRGSYVGVGFSNNGSMNRVHINMVDMNSSQVTDPAKFATVLKNPNAVSQDEADAARQALAQAESTLVQAKQNLEAAQKGVDETAAAQSRLERAKDDLAKAEANYNKVYEKAKAAASAEEKAKLSALENAKTALAAKEAALKTAQDSAASENKTLADLKAKTAEETAKVASAQAVLAAAQQAVQDAKDYLNRLENAPALVQEASQALAAAQADLAVKEATYQKEVAVLNALKLLESSKVGDPTATSNGGRARVQNLANSAPKTNGSASKTGRNLPATGQKASSDALLGASILGLLGLFGFKRKKAE